MLPSAADDHSPMLVSPNPARGQVMERARVHVWGGNHKGVVVGFDPFMEIQIRTAPIYVEGLGRVDGRVKGDPVDEVLGDRQRGGERVWRISVCSCRDRSAEGLPPPAAREHPQNREQIVACLPGENNTAREREPSAAQESEGFILLISRESSAVEWECEERAREGDGRRCVFGVGDLQRRCMLRCGEGGFLGLFLG
ncbi:uncharacterized protein LOC131150526 [Malania oleifera]|uniref:uncharacterized protein LOC131150526 n=1 Tax=Malania oleifera TaxID=397392 RepID=UPI0025AE0B6F|nr:uncharacterized protein LOC131150526 [Malania oleifera]